MLEGLKRVSAQKLRFLGFEEVDVMKGVRGGRLGIAL